MFMGRLKVGWERQERKEITWRDLWQKAATETLGELTIVVRDPFGIDLNC